MKTGFGQDKYKSKKRIEPAIKAKQVMVGNSGPFITGQFPAGKKGPGETFSGIEKPDLNQTEQISE
jgi:hypothetical protein